MVRKIRYKVLTAGCSPVVNDNGDAFDLRAAKNVALDAPTVNSEGAIEFNSAVVPLGVIIELPKGCKADVKPRSSTFKKWRVMQPNTPGLIDCTYCGDIPNAEGKVDEWGMPVLSFANSHIKKGDRICQFEIRPSHTATLWQKIKWALTTRYEFVEVESLGNIPRGGFGEGTKGADKK